MGAGVTATASQGIKQVRRLGVGGIKGQHLAAEGFGLTELIDLPVHTGQGFEGGDVSGGQGAGPLQHGDRLLPVVVLVDPLG